MEPMKHTAPPIIVPLLCILSVAMTGCSPKHDVEEVFRFAGDNRPQLEAVLEHYRESGERLKYKAAEYLIGNMGEDAAMEGPSLDRYYELLEEFNSRPDAEIFGLRALNDSIFAEGSFSDLKPSFDARTLDSAYLVSHIDRAFETWQSPWAANLDFDEFCEYLLPYRIGDEVIEDWRTDYEEFYGPFLDSIASAPGAALADFCEAVNSACATPHLYSRYPKDKPSLKPSVLKNIVGGSCDDYVSLFTYIARTFGIPVTTDFTPQWGNHSQGHKWCAIMGQDSTYHFEIGGELCSSMNNPFVYRLVKAYRNLDEPPYLADVTAEYCPVTDVRIRNLNTDSDDKAVYLCAFDDRQWIPVCGTRRKGRTAVFKDMEYPSVFLPMHFSGDALVPAGCPVLVDDKGETRELKPDTSRPVKVRLLRKFMDLRAWEFVDSLRGGHFELASDKDFKDAYRIELPDSLSYVYQDLEIEDTRRCRYLRYVPAACSPGNIAEIEVYGTDGGHIRGGVIGNYDSRDTLHKMSKAFDGDVLTYARCMSSQHDAWVGLDFGKEVEVSRICFLPRSDDNFIREGELYELCFWDGRWVSLGTRTGSRQTQELIYDNVPSNALLLLHNLSKGKEERIFTYENGRQVWW